MDTGFIDLDVLFERVRNPQSRVYFRDAVKAYKAGALRASLTSAWVAIVYDLISKYRELDAQGDGSVSEFIQSWDNATEVNDRQKLLKLEMKILDDATKNSQVIDRVACVHLMRIREDRNLYAHPAFSTESTLFDPSPELVRLHLVSAIDLVLSQEPLQGKAILDSFSVDVQSIGFPTEHARILDYVDQRYLKRVRPQSMKNFGIILSKSLIKGEPPQWEAEYGKIVSSLVAVQERAEQVWPDVFSIIANLINDIEPKNRPRAIAFIAVFPDVWRLLQEPVKTALQETANNADPAKLTEYRMLAGVKLPQFRNALLSLITKLDQNQIRDAIALQPLDELWPIAVEFYKGSVSFRDSESNFRKLITPFSHYLNSQQYDQLLDAVVKNGQNWDAADTKNLLSDVLCKATNGEYPTHNARNRFYQHVHRVERIEQYKEVIDFFQKDGWEVLPLHQGDDKS